MHMRAASLLPLLLMGGAAHPFGPDGHRIVGHVAEPRLCAAALAQVRALGEAQGLGELGLWADRVRREPRWDHSAPWHYMNINDGVPLAGYESPPEGDVLSAIAAFSDQLGQQDRSPMRRAEALKFVVHFVADLHQPLHVGRASDRGGNRIDVVVDGIALNLHRFWDTEVIAIGGLTSREYTARYVEPLARQNEDVWASQPLLEWAQESLDLRDFVYSFGEPGDELSAGYRAEARDIIIERLAQAGVRVAATLNGILCAGVS